MGIITAMQNEILGMMKELKHGHMTEKDYEIMDRKTKLVAGALMYEKVRTQQYAELLKAHRTDPKFAKKFGYYDLPDDAVPDLESFLGRDYLESELIVCAYEERDIPRKECLEISGSAESIEFCRDCRHYARTRKLLLPTDREMKRIMDQGPPYRDVASK